MHKKDLGLFVLILVVGGITAFLNPRFLSPVNLVNMANLIGLFGLFAIGEGLVIITGGIELSVGSMFALIGVIFTDLMVNHGLPWQLVMPVAIGMGAGLGAIHGLLITRLNMQPFVVTLCGLLIYRGLARFITADETKGFGTVTGLDFLRFLANGNLGGIPMPFVLLLIISFITWVALHRSVYGRYLFATGRNAEAARYAGINTKWIIT